MATIQKTEKRCPRCGRVLPAAEFGRSAYTTDGLFVYCKDCWRAYQAEYYAAHPRRKHPADYVPLVRRTREEVLAHRRELRRRREQLLKAKTTKTDKAL
jgi:hypothetical protein